ncbi:MAG: hypothetical protein HYW48_01870 [Deltaproteobacteria bacterium]|nr:hypothetical protein [Deltaproteobacteria bacterium]
MKRHCVHLLSLCLFFFTFIVPHARAAGDVELGEVNAQVAEVLKTVVEHGADALHDMGIQADPKAVATAVQTLGAVIIKYLLGGNKLTKEWLSPEVDTAFGNFFPADTKTTQLDKATQIILGGLQWKSPYTALAADTAIFGGGFLGILSYTFVIKKMEKLNGFAKTVLVNAPLITGALPRLPLGWYANRADGGVLSLRVATGLAAAGLAAIAVLSHFTDIETIEGAGDPLYWAWLGAGLLIGAGISTYSPGVINAKNWFLKEQAGVAQGIFGGLGNMLPAVLAATLAHVISGLGYTWTYALWTGVLGVFALVTFPFLATPPAQVAGRAALATGLKLPAANFWTTAGKALISPDKWIYSYLYLASFGAFISMPNILGFYNSDPHYTPTPYALESTHLGYIIAGYIFVSSLTRSLSGILVDKIGGPIVAISGLLVGTLGTVPLALHARPFDGDHVGSSIAWWSGLAGMGLGWGAAMAATFGWIAQKTPAAEFGITGGMAGAIGACGFINSWLAYYMGGWSSTAISGTAVLAAAGLASYQRWYRPAETH